MAKKEDVKFYMGNQNLPSKGSSFAYTPEQIAELEKCSKNILHFAENYFFILNVDDGKKKIKLYKAQKRVLRKMMDNRFFCLLASRQIGKSTLMTIYILWIANFFPDQRILLVANKESTAIEIFSRVRMAYEMLPNWLKSPVVEYAKTSMELENNSRISITTTTGTAARGQSVSVLIIDECAFIECVDGDTSITIRNKETGEVEDISIYDFYNKLENDIQNG
jgi:tRNA(Met) C34 N-acetyltransferase TmcA